VFFGLIGPYKGVDALISSFRAIAAEDVSLAIIGQPSSRAMRRLSLGRPVLTIDTAINRAIRELGPGWVWLYEGAITNLVIERTLREVSALERPGDTRPTFDARDWRSIG
jgi:beta-1,4-mannosyltransferase